MANAWYRTGTISVTNGSATITGSGTLFLNNVNPGDMLFGPDGNIYEIDAIADNVTATIKQKNGTAAYLGSTLTGQAYSIIKTGPNNATVATQLTTLAAGWQQDRDQYANWLGGTSTGGDGSGNYPLTDALGVTRNVACPAKLAVSFMPLAGSAGQAFSVGALTATTAHFVGGNATGFNIDNGGQQYTEIDISNNGTLKAFIYYDNTNKFLLFRSVASGEPLCLGSNVNNVLVGATTSVTGAKLEVTGSGSFTGSVYVNGINRLSSILYTTKTDNSTLTMDSISVSRGTLKIVETSCITYIPFFITGGHGVAYVFTFCTSAGWQINTNGAFTHAVNNGNTYSVTFPAATAAISIARTAGTSNYTCILLFD